MVFSTLKKFSANVAGKIPDYDGKYNMKTFGFAAKHVKHHICVCIFDIFQEIKKLTQFACEACWVSLAGFQIRSVFFISLMPIFHKLLCLTT